MTDFSDPEMKEYWRLHSKTWTSLDRDMDPEGLTNVCYNGAPVWYNRFFDKAHRRGFHRLSRSIPLSRKKALDVGCGTGRWCKVLARRGAVVTGIDLQPETITDNRKRIKGVNFKVMPADKMALRASSFDLVDSVTVLQHIPPETQEKAVKEMVRVTKPGGHILIIEVLKDRDRHVFPRRPEEWAGLFAKHGCRLIRKEGVVYAPLSHGFDVLAKSLHGLRRKRRDLSVKKYLENISNKKSLLYHLFYLLKWPIIMVSYPLEPVIERLLPPTYADHLGMLFVKERG